MRQQRGYCQFIRRHHFPGEELSIALWQEGDKWVTYRAMRDDDGLVQVDVIRVLSSGENARADFKALRKLPDHVRAIAPR